MARAIAVQKPETHDKSDVLSSHPAANHNVAEMLPQYTVTTQEAARLRREAMALDAALVKPLPWDIDARLAWMERIQGAAWHDRDALARVAIDDSDRITPALVHDFGVRLEWVRGEVAAARNTTAVTAEQAAALSTPALRARIEASHKKLHNALMYRFRNDDAQRTELRKAGRGRSRAKVSARSVLLLDLAA